MTVQLDIRRHVSVFVALEPTGPASAEGILRGRLLSYPSVYLPTVGALRGAGFELLPTFRRPHFTVLMSGPELAPVLFEALGELRDNPYAVREGGPRG